MQVARRQVVGMAVFLWFGLNKGSTSADVAIVRMDGRF